MFQLNDIVPDKEPRFVFIADYPASEDFITGIPASGEFGRSTMRLLRQKSDQLISDKLNLGVSSQKHSRKPRLFTPAGFRSKIPALAVRKMFLKKNGAVETS